MRHVRLVDDASKPIATDGVCVWLTEKQAKALIATLKARLSVPIDGDRFALVLAFVEETEGRFSRPSD